MEFSYEKETIAMSGIINGRFQFLIDYEVVLVDTVFISESKTVRYNLSKGYHIFLWQYGVLNEVNSSSTNNLNAKIINIVIDGTEDLEYGCKSCVEGISIPGSEYCNKCESNYYFNVEKVRLLIIFSKNV